jgi:hypothetical protein
MMSRKTAQDAATVWSAGSPDGKVTMGTVIHLLKQHYGDNCLIATDNEKYGITLTGKKFIKRKVGV